MIDSEHPLPVSAGFKLVGIARSSATVPSAEQEPHECGAQDLAVPTAQPEDRSRQSGVGAGHEQHSDGAGLRVSDGGGGLGQPQSTGKVLAHRVAITLESCHAVQALEEAFAKYGTPCGWLPDRTQPQDQALDGVTITARSGYVCSRLNIRRRDSATRPNHGAGGSTPGLMSADGRLSLVRSSQYVEPA